MCVLYVMVVAVFMFSCTKCDTNLTGVVINLKSEKVSDPLPPIFHIDRDYKKCKADGKFFCKLSVVLSSRDLKNVSYYWKLIEESIKDKRAYNHNELFHAVCVNDTCPSIKTVTLDETFKEILSTCYSKKYEHLGLLANVTHFSSPNEDTVYKAEILDFIWLFVVCAYLSYVIFASFYDNWLQNRRKNNNNFKSSDFEKTYVIPFSVINNWQKLKRENRNPDFQKLKCIQGIRFYNMLLIIFCHTYSSFIGGYVENTIYIDDIPKNPVKLGIRNLFVFLVQTFFLISAFLLSYHIFQIMDRTKLPNNKCILLTFLNRYLRIIPPVLVMIGLGCTMWVLSLFDGPIKDLYSDLEYKRCRKNWWTILLFVNNHYNQHDMCYFITWYLAADTQLYILSLIILSIIWRFRKRTNLILTFCVTIGILIPSVISYVYNLDIIYRITPENSKNNKFRSFNFNAIYSSTYANMATYMVGLSMGYFYFTQKNRRLFKDLPSKLLWLFGFIGLPTLVVILSSFYYTRFYSAMLCGVLKPLYAVGIGIGILGMSRQVGGLLKSVCEWKPAVCLGNVTYSTYVVHYGIVFYRTATAKQPLYVSDYVLITSFVCDAVLSFSCGLLMHLLVEIPALQLQNMFVPQVRIHRSSDPSNKKE